MQALDSRSKKAAGKDEPSSFGASFMKAGGLVDAMVVPWRARSISSIVDQRKERRNGGHVTSSHHCYRKREFEIGMNTSVEIIASPEEKKLPPAGLITEPQTTQKSNWNNSFTLLSALCFPHLKFDVRLQQASVC